jgi:hypothetical protein
MRDDFSEKTKQLLAKRVAWKCSFPGCNIPTIGPGLKDSSSIVNLGEAAHICAASANGPRYEPSMTYEQRISIDNAIWMCRHHARLIDADFINYSAATLRQWKENAERQAYRKLKEANSALNAPMTLVSLRPDLIFEGVWLSAIDEQWTFKLVNFVAGDMGQLKDHVINFSNIAEINKYVVIESQGDGREIDKLHWTFKDDHYEVSSHVLPKSQRISPHDVGGDIAIGADFDIFFRDGDFATVTGIDSAIQSLRIALSSQLGDYKQNPNLGSFLTKYFWNYISNPSLLQRLIKIEVIRLLSVPIFDTWTQEKTPLLNFINRVIDIEILDFAPIKGQIPLQFVLEWGNGEQWKGNVSLYVGKNGGPPSLHPFADL